MIVIILVICIVLLVAFSLAQIHPEQAYLVAARPLPAGTILTSEDFNQAYLDPTNISQDAVQAGDVNSILGRAIAIPFAQGDIITRTHLGNTSIAANVPKDMRVFKLPTKDVVMPDGLQAGDKLDIILTLHQSSGAVVTIYAIEGLTIQSMAPDNSSITFWVPPNVAALLVHAQQGGQIVLLAAPPDEQFVVLPPVTTDQQCQIFIDPHTGELTTSTLGGLPCPSPTPGDQPSPTPTKTPRP